MTTAEFIEKAKAVHGDKYDYSKVEYVDCRTKVCIICQEHGEFWQTANDHLNGSGCPKCANNSRINKRTPNIESKEDFIKRAIEVHGNKYDYSKVNYINRSTKVCIICPTHGEFWQIASNHLKGFGCPKCGKLKQQQKKPHLTTEGFIERAREVHGNKYDYSKVNYVNSATKVCIICPEHGEFWQMPNNHLRRQDCPMCTSKHRYTTDEWVAKAKEVHGNKYDYSKVNYVNANTKVIIICKEHGEFEQTPNSHLNGRGCAKCSGRHIYTTKEWIAEARKVHGNKYDYSKVNYVNSATKVCIICPEHGEFWQIATSHLQGTGCPNCNSLTKEYKFNLLQEFESEYDFRAFLDNNDINILYVILRNIEPKFDPIKKDIEKALANADAIDPIKALEDKYTSDSEDEEDDENTNDDKEINNDDEDFEAATAPTVDLDDDDAIDEMTSKEEEEATEKTAPTIEDVIANTEREIKVINKIEHMLTPEDREYIMNKFLNDKRRVWMLKRENSIK